LKDLLAESTNVHPGKYLEEILGTRSRVYIMYLFQKFLRAMLQMFE
jgi:hypothetical protein